MNNIEQQAAGLLKLEPLVRVDPNDQEALISLVKIAKVKASNFDFNLNDPHQLCKLALLVNHLGESFDQYWWVEQIFNEPNQPGLERLTEVYLYLKFEAMGAEEIDFNQYCLEKYNRRFQGHDYDEKDIFVATQMGLKTAKEQGFTDLLCTYDCVELILLTALDFMSAEQCKDIQAIFKNDKLEDHEKISQSQMWLMENYEQLMDSLEA